MRRTLTYLDAVRLLGRDDSAFLDLVDRLSGMALLATGNLHLLGARTELVRLGRTVLGSLKERVSGLKRHDRTQRLEAAHAIVVVTAFFEALAEAELPFDVADLELTVPDKLAMARPDGPPRASMINLPSILLGHRLPMPVPTVPYERVVAELSSYYEGVALDFCDLLTGLAVWDQLTERDRDRVREAARGPVPAAAVRRYEEHYRRLAVDCPEFFVWASMQDHAGTRALLSDLEANVCGGLAGLYEQLDLQNTALTGMRDLLRGVAGVDILDDRRQRLARAYRATLDKPIVETGDAPGGLVVPPLGAGYVDPQCRVGVVTAGDDPSQDSWWEPMPRRADLQGLLAGHFTSSQATEAPLVVLGQPGSGKSVLTRMLAAQLPAGDFLPVRVVLRDVPADVDLQDQIEHAIRAATGERLSWPDLARSAGQAVPVVLLDGFDELLQATGVNQSDYLTRIQAFQRREADQDRPVVVVVTSRTAVANRARFPDGTTVLRLEPFGEEHVSRWLDVWNRANAGYFAAHGLSPLSAQAALAHPDLAQQPLLLMMLALYDASGNALQSSGGSLAKAELYERLLDRFARREIEKDRTDLPPELITEAVERELYRLSVVAFAMFNRGAQWVTETDLNADLPVLLKDRAPTPESGLRAPLTAAQIVVGRFFFVHEARAARDDQRLHTYEFLHATFGEYLVARLMHRALHRMVLAKAAAGASPFDHDPVDDRLLHALLSFTPLSVSTATLGFLGELFDGFTEPHQRLLSALLRQLLTRARYPRDDRGLDRYEPRPLTLPARIASYTSNLVLLAVLIGRETLASTLFGPEDPIAAWRREALLWRSQFTPDEWRSVVGCLAPQRIHKDGTRDLCLRLDDGTFETPLVGTQWSLLSRVRLRGVQRQNYFMCDAEEDLANDTLEPLVHALEPAYRLLFSKGAGEERSLANVLLTAWLAPARRAPLDERVSLYRRLVSLDAGPGRHDCVNLALELLLRDSGLPADSVLDVLHSIGPILSRLRKDLVTDCALKALGSSESGDNAVMVLLGAVLFDPTRERDPLMLLRAWVGVAEHGRSEAAKEEVPDFDDPVQFLTSTIDLAAVAATEPSLVRRARWAATDLGIADLVTWPAGC
ncbi:hypothetical protein F0L68_30630 [Solihabitans fulvus]|uniref:NACHT N-terminal Helical domain-containing protein n=1 Tax=Solihabitans fulvus TaxID=1892852 RepID=A0A5B2WRY7_9PSEU|nr:hypothetical protein [Solihabitans fulvus]KAA2254285.1 hypothetical protein F0L68_30630 [Solihabitans fulvus]